MWPHVTVRLVQRRNLECSGCYSSSCVTKYPPGSCFHQLVSVMHCERAVHVISRWPGLYMSRIMLTWQRLPGHKRAMQLFKCVE